MSYGSREKPVSLDPFQTIIAVKWTESISRITLRYNYKRTEADGRFLSIVGTMTDSGIPALDYRYFPNNEDVPSLSTYSYLGILKLFRSPQPFPEEYEEMSIDVSEMRKKNANLKTFTFYVFGYWAGLNEFPPKNVTVEIRAFNKLKQVFYSSQVKTVQSTATEYGPAGTLTYTKPSKVDFT